MVHPTLPCFLPLPDLLVVHSHCLWPTSLKVPRMVTLVQHLRRYFVLASYATVNLCTSQSVSGKQEALARTRFIPPLEAVLLAGRFPLHKLLWRNQATCPDLQYKINDTQNKRPSMYDQEPGCITGRYFLTSVQLSHVMTLAYITLTLKIGNKIWNFKWLP